MGVYRPRSWLIPAPDFVEVIIDRFRSHNGEHPAKAGLFLYVAPEDQGPIFADIARALHAAGIDVGTTRRELPGGAIAMIDGLEIRPDPAVPSGKWTLAPEGRAAEVIRQAVGGDDGEESEGE